MRLVHATPALGLLLAVTLLGAPARAGAQGSAEVAELPGSATRTFGTSTIVHTLQAHAFTPLNPSDVTAVASSPIQSRFCTSASCALGAPVFLPAGAVLEGFELDACDASASGRLTAAFSRVATKETGGLIAAAVILTGLGAAPGCDLFTAPIDPLTIDNRNNAYNVTVGISGNGTSSTRFQAVRIFYRLQVSPAPATARFDDVPTGHGFFRFIEALAAAGITTGCSVSPPLYCPDNFVTRGQMAAFLSRALGLHFVP